MPTVSHVMRVVEAQLNAGQLQCLVPGCGGGLAPSWYGGERPLIPARGVGGAGRAGGAAPAAARPVAGGGLVVAVAAGRPAVTGRPAFPGLAAGGDQREFTGDVAAGQAPSWLAWPARWGPASQRGGAR